VDTTHVFWGRALTDVFLEVKDTYSNHQWQTDFPFLFYLRLAKGVISFHGQHKDDVKKWLKYCERKLNEINEEADEINAVHEEYSKLQVSFTQK
jgi:hypothetical protein